MTVEINAIEIGTEQIVITATNLEAYLLQEDLYQEIDEKPVTFAFDRHAHNGAAMKYLYKIVSSQRKCKQAKSFGEKLESLTGVILYLSDNFRI